LAAMSTALIADLSPANLRAIELGDIASLGTRQIRALTPFQMAALNNAQLSQLTIGQARAMTANQYNTLSAQQQSVFTPEQKAAMPFVTPLVLDLDGNGVRTLGLEAGVQFDLAASGGKRNTGWVGQGDGLLALDRNHDGVINDGSELFGSATQLADGRTAGNGYQALASIDSNGDGVIDAKDALFGDLRVWVDANADGLSQAGELKTLGELHIASLQLNAQRGNAVDNDNLIGMTSTYTTDDGQTHASADVWFAQGMSGNVSGMAQALSAYAGGSASTPPASGQLAMHSARLAEALQQYGAAGLSTGSAVHTEHDTQRLKALQASAPQGLLAAPR